MAKGVLDIGEVLALKEVNKDEIECVDSYFKVEITSLERFLGLVNSPLIRSANEILEIKVRGYDIDRDDNARLSGETFFVGNGTFSSGGNEMQRLTYDGEPLGIAFTDGGIEYLQNIRYLTIHRNADYHCNLVVPSTRLVLEYIKPIRDEKVLEVLKRTVP